MRFLSVALAVVMMTGLSFAGGHGKGGGQFGRGNGHGSHSKPAKQKPRAEPRSQNWKEERAPSARDEFMRKTGFPKGRPGWVIEYLIPFSKGGTDTSVNMRWKEKPQKAKGGSDKQMPPRQPKPKNKDGAPRHNR